MKRNWTPTELASHFTLNWEDLELVGNSRDATRLGFAIALKFFQAEGAFPENPDAVPLAVIHHVAQQVGVPGKLFADYFVGSEHSSAAKKHRSRIRAHLGFRTPTLTDIRGLVVWMSEEVLPKEPRSERLRAIASEHLRQMHVEPPSSKQMDRLLGTAIRRFELRLSNRILEQISQETRESMDWLLETGERAERDEKDLSDAGMVEGISTRCFFHQLQQEPSGSNLISVHAEVTKLQWIRQLCLPSRLFEGIASKVLQQYRRRAATEPARELRRHPDPIRYTLVAAFCFLRQKEITDTLVELLIRITQRMGSRAEQRLSQELLNDFRRVKSKAQILYRVAAAALSHPTGVVREVIYPVVGEETLRDLVREQDVTGRVFQAKVQNRMRSSYGNHYRPMLPLLLNALEFCSAQRSSCPILRALALVRKHLDSSRPFYPVEESVPVEGVISEEWVDMVVEPDSTPAAPRINRITYELAVLHTLRGKLSCKEIWVVGGHRYRDPVPPRFDIVADFQIVVVGF